MGTSDVCQVTEASRRIHQQQRSIRMMTTYGLKELVPESLHDAGSMVSHVPVEERQFRPTAG